MTHARSLIAQVDMHDRGSSIVGLLSSDRHLSLFFSRRLSIELNQLRQRTGVTGIEKTLGSVSTPLRAAVTTALRETRPLSARCMS